MSRTISTARFAAVLAIAVVLFTAGIVSGAAGDPLILGSLLNNSGASGTKVSSSVNGNAFAVAQTGAGNSANGIRGDAASGTGGVFTSSSNNALFATAASGNRFAMVAVSNGGAGTGGALLADGNANPAIDIDTNNGVPPMTVNQQALVTNLNSDEVDHWDVGCPSGTTWAGGLCLETAVRTAASVYTAADTCAALGSNIFTGRGQQWMLPSPLQLRGAHNNNDIDLSGSGEWSDSLFVDDANGYEAMVAYGIGDTTTLLLNDDAAASHPYRCGAVPLSFDPITIVLPLGSPENDQGQVGPAEGVHLGPLNEDGTPAD